MPPSCSSRVREGEREGKEAGRGWKRSKHPSVRLPGADAVGQDPAVRWGQLPAGVYGFRGVSAGEQYSRQLSERAEPAFPAASATTASLHPANSHSGGSQQPGHHLRSLRDRGPELPPESQQSRYCPITHTSLTH